MLARFQNIFNRLNTIRAYLLLADILVVFFLILLFNAGVLPFKNVGDFMFFAFLGLVFALYRPGWAFLFFIGTAALENINLAPESFPIMLRPYQFIGGITVLAILIRMIMKRLHFQLAKLAWYDIAFIVFAAAGFLSAVFAVDKGISLKQSVVFASFVFLYFLVRNYVQNFDDLKKVVPFLVSSSVIVVLYGIWQNVRFMKGLAPFETMPGRPNGTFAEADWLAVYLVLVVAVIYALIYYFSFHQKLASLELWRSERIILRLNYLFLISAYILLILTVSRSAWLGAGIITLVFLKAILTNFSFRFSDWRWKEFLKQLSFIAGAVIISVGIVYIFNLTSFQLFNRAQSTGTGLQKITVACKENVSLPEKITSSEELIRYGCRHINLEEIKMEEMQGNYIKEIYRDDPNVSIRREIYQKSWAEIKKNPILGIGWGNIGSILGTDERGAKLNSSNIFLEVWLGSGIIGLLAFLAIWSYIFIQSIKKAVKEDFESKFIGLLMLLGFFALLIPNLFNAGIFLVILWLYWGIALSLTRN